MLDIPKVRSRLPCPVPDHKCKYVAQESSTGFRGIGQPFQHVEGDVGYGIGEEFVGG